MLADSATFIYILVYCRTRFAILAGSADPMPVTRSQQGRAAPSLDAPDPAGSAGQEAGVAPHEVVSILLQVLGRSPIAVEVLDAKSRCVWVAVAIRQDGSIRVATGAMHGGRNWWRLVALAPELAFEIAAPAAFA